MLKEKRIMNIISRMQDCDALLISDSYAIAYLTGRKIEAGERFLGLLIRKDRKPLLIINSLFPFEKMEGLDLISYSDGEDLCGLLRGPLEGIGVLGVDKNLPARFLLPIQAEKLAESFINGSLYVDSCRAIKDEEEIMLMKEASRINDEAMAILKTLVKEGCTELSIAEQLLDIYKKLGAEAYSFDPIVAFGKNSADPHHMPDDTRLEYGDAVLFDIGCRYHGYCSDMTRTFFYKEGPKGERLKVYELVKRANEEAESYVRAGRRLCDIDRTARDIISDGGYGDFFTHRLGHFIGLEDHEYGDVSAAFNDPCVPGNVFSIEPGIYDPATLGCRIEDLVIVTEDGCEILNHYPHTIEIIE